MFLRIRLSYYLDGLNLTYAITQASTTFSRLYFSHQRAVVFCQSGMRRSLLNFVFAWSFGAPIHLAGFILRQWRR